MAKILAGRPELRVEPRLSGAGSWPEAARVALETWRKSGRESFISDVVRAQKNKYFKPGQRTWGRKQTGEEHSGYADRLDAVDDALSRADVAALSSCAVLFPGPEEQAVDGGGPFVSAARDALLELWHDNVDAPVARFIQWTRDELPRRKTQRRLQTFDDLLQQVQRAVTDGGPENPLVKALRSRYRAALIDEFQDTDPVQWEIFGTLFRDSSKHRLVLVGDPKQAIYSFRGADVFVYRGARDATPEPNRRTMDVNHRCDGRLVHGLNTLFADRGPVFEVSGIDYHRVCHAQDRKPWDAVVQEDDVPPVVVRWFDNRVLGRSDDDNDVTDVDRVLPDLVAADVDHLLAGGGELEDVRGNRRRVSARDVAVLTRTNRQAEKVQGALAARNIVAVIPAQGSVFLAQEAGWLRRWLRAVGDPVVERGIRTLALTPLVGWDAPALLDVLDNREADWERLVRRVRQAGRAYQEGGLSRALAQFLEEGEVEQRLARRRDGERCLTNLYHLGELMHVAWKENHWGPSAMADWLQERATSAEQGDEADDDEPVRLESDEDAVRVTTVHKSKGLEYPFTFVPFLWNGNLLKGTSKKLFLYHEGSTSCLDARVLRPDRDREEAKSRAEAEVLQENMRLLYVALTRAQHRTVVYWGLTKFKKTAPLGVLLHGGDDVNAAAGTRSTVAAGVIGGVQKDGVKATVDALAARSLKTLPEGRTRAAAVGWDETTLAEINVVLAGRSGATEPSPAPPLAARSFQRETLVTPWTRTSYTALTGAQHGAPVLLGDDDGKDHDVERGPSSFAVAFPPWTGQDEVDVPLAHFNGGREAGTFVHALLEKIDFTDGRELAPPRREVGELARALAGRTGQVEEKDLEMVVQALPGVLKTPLGSRAGGVSLAGLAPVDRLNELQFDMALRGGACWRAGEQAIQAKELGEVLGTPRPDLPEVAAAYFQSLREDGLHLAPLAGFMNGSMDLVYRVPGPDGPRFYVADYKTNWLGVNVSPGEPSRSTRQHFTRPWLAVEMARKHYVIQYYIYLAALHRYLRSRLPGYDYDKHVGGAVYLFLRGMDGSLPREGECEPPGVFVDRPPRSIVEGLDALFAGGTP
jgi:exodeoxyribonuclease V beta subunit